MKKPMFATQAEADEWMDGYLEDAGACDCDPLQTCEKCIDLPAEWSTRE